MKDFNMGNRLSLISKQGGTINFGGSYVFSAAQKSGFKGYTLDAILYLLVNRGLSIQEYLKQANVNKVSTISMIDRKVGLSEQHCHIGIFAQRQAMFFSYCNMDSLSWSFWMARENCISRQSREHFPPKPLLPRGHARKVEAWDGAFITCPPTDEGRALACMHGWLVVPMHPGFNCMRNCMDVLLSRQTSEGCMDDFLFLVWISLAEEEGEIEGIESLSRQERQLRNRNTMLVRRTAMR